MNEYRLEIGKIVLGLRLPASHSASMEEYFQRHSSFISPHIYLSVDLFTDGLHSTIPESFYISKRLVSCSFMVGDGLIRGDFDPIKRRGRVQVADFLFHGRLVRVFEQLLYQAFYSACKLDGYAAHLVHGAGIVREGKGFLFVGPPGAGKSTLAQLSQTESVLNDEISLIEIADGRVTIRDTPFNGFYRQKVKGCAPLKAVFLLEHGPYHEILDLTPAEAVKALFRQLVPPVGLEDSLAGSSLGQMLDVAERLVETFPVKLLRFRPDNGFWSEIERTFIRG